MIYFALLVKWSILNTMNRVSKVAVGGCNVVIGVMEGRHLLKKGRTVVAVQSLLGHSSYSNGKM